MKLQQGDVWLKVSDMKGLKDGKKLDHLVLAEGEATGHRHQITSGVAQLILLGNKQILQVLSDYAKLHHEEHDVREMLRRKGSFENLSEKDREYLDWVGIEMKGEFNDFLEQVPREVILKKGTYEYGIVKEFDYDEEELRRVLD